MLSKKKQPLRRLKTRIVYFKLLQIPVRTCSKDNKKLMLSFKRLKRNSDEAGASGANCMIPTRIISDDCCETPDMFGEP